MLPSELAAALLAVGIARAYVDVGLPALALFGVVLLIFQYLLGALLLSQQRGDELELRARQLASFQVAVLSALLRTLDLRDRMTARHSAAVARYSREIAAAAGLPEQEQELAHTAGLLHDIGKFILPDRILKGDEKLTEEDWEEIKRHPYEGARIVSEIDGYGPVGEIILAHHERTDGNGYPRGLQGDEIPLISRIISVADTYDVMTARDSYRDPVSSLEAIDGAAPRRRHTARPALRRDLRDDARAAGAELSPRRGRGLRGRARARSPHPRLRRSRQRLDARAASVSAAPRVAAAPATTEPPPTTQTRSAQSSRPNGLPASLDTHSHPAFALGF